MLTPRSRARWLAGRFGDYVVAVSDGERRLAEELRIGRDGPLVLGDGKLDVVNGETIDASFLSGDGTPLSATAFMDCDKRLCRLSELRPVITGDCDRDGAADPGEIWTFEVPVLNYQTEPFDVVATLETADTNIMLLV